MRYSTNGFRLANVIGNDGLVYYPVATTINIAKGDVVNDNGSGYATNVLTAFDATVLGIAAAPANNASGANGAIDVAVIPLLPNYHFWVKNESGTVAAQTDVGEVIDLESQDGVDVTDTSVVVWGFHVDEVDISAAAIAANAGGFVKGHFLRQPQ